MKIKEKHLSLKIKVDDNNHCSEQCDWISATEYGWACNIFSTTYENLYHSVNGIKRDKECIKYESN